MIEKEFLFPKLKAKTFDEAVTHMGNKMNTKGYVKSSYVGAVIDREKEFPTGLKIGNYVIAIPHTEQDHVDIPVLSIATLNEPIKVHSMINPVEELQANVMILMAIKDPDNQVKMLSKLMSIFQDVELLQKLELTTSKKEMLEELKETSLVKNN